MPLIWKGVFFGLSLSILVGPLLFALLGASLERGFRSGIAFASGIWVSDVAFIALVYKSVERVAEFTRMPGFRFWAGFVGGVVLILMGLQMVYRNRRNQTPIKMDTTKIGEKVLDKLDGPEAEGEDENWKSWGYFGYFFRGFLMNVFNPFTIFFWLAFATTYVLPNDWSTTQLFEFFIGMMASLVTTDTIKAFSAKKIKEILTPKQIRTIQYGIGLMIIGFGVFLILRAFYF